MNVNLGCRLEGILTLRTIAANGEVTQQREFKNMVLDGGLQGMISGGNVANLCLYCLVGTGNTPPNASQITLVNKLAAQVRDNTRISYNEQYTAPAYGGISLSYRFPAGRATGNLAEIGFSPGETPAANNPMFSRALIRDAGGNPTTITVLPTEALDVTYQVRMYWPTQDVSGSFVIGGVTHQYTGKIMRIQSKNDVSGSGVMANNWFSTSNGAQDSSRVWATVTTPATSTTDPVGTLHQNARWGGEQRSPVTAGVLSRDLQHNTVAGTIPTGKIAAVEYRWANGTPRMVIEFTPPIDIDVTQSLTVQTTSGLSR